MKRRINQSFWTTVLCFLGAVVFVACSETQDATKYYNYFNTFQPGSFIEINSGDFVYQLQYRPREFQGLKELKGSVDLNSSRLDQVVDSFADENLFCLRIYSKDRSSDVLKHGIYTDAEYYHRVEMLSSSFNLMTYGVDDQDTARVGFHHFERTYQLRPFTQLLFSINQDRLNADHIVYEDYIFNNGTPIVFKDIQTYIKHLPKLNL